MGNRKIPLTRGKFATVDEADFAELSRHTWYAFTSKEHWYAARKAGRLDVDVPYRSVIFMHKQLLNTNSLVDHKDGNGLNNVRANLRPATYSQNNCNRNSRIGSSSKFLGVIWDKSRSLWQAKLTYQGVVRHLGRFSSEEEAAKVYDAAAKQLYGEFANPNFSESGV